MYCFSILAHTTFCYKEPFRKKYLRRAQQLAQRVLRGPDDAHSVVHQVVGQKLQRRLPDRTAIGPAARGRSRVRGRSAAWTSALDICRHTLKMAIQPWFKEYLQRESFSEHATSPNLPWTSLHNVQQIHRYKI